MATRLTLENDAAVLVLPRDLNLATVTEFWQEIQSTLRTPPASLIIDASELEACDSAGISILVDLRRRQSEKGRGFEIRNFPAKYQPLLDLVGTESPPGTQREVRPRFRLAEEVGQATIHILGDGRELIAFLGQLTAALAFSLLRPHQIRWKDALVSFEKAGVNAVPIVGLVGFLLGLILAFQSAVPLKRFGADFFVAGLVAMTLFRELGPLVTAIILAGRSGSAFAAELGTMKINEEIDALVTMGLEPVRFLVVTRVIAGVAVMPFLTLFMDLFGMVGASVVTLSMGYPLVTFINQLQATVNVVDLLGGLFKSLCFGLLVSGVGCLRGLQTRSGASAVGDSATGAVVSGIVLLAVADSIFAVVFNYLGI